MKAVAAVALVFTANLLYGSCINVPDEGTAGFPLQFFACDEAAIWSFGDDTQASGASVTHTYAAGGMYNWSVQSPAMGEQKGQIAITELAGGQCSFCPLNVPTDGDSTKPVQLGSICPNVSSFVWSFSDGYNITTSTSLCPGGGGCPVFRGFAPGVYSWTLSMMSQGGQTCQTAGRITIIGCKVTSLSVDKSSGLPSGSVNLSWKTNDASDCHPGGDVKSVSFEIDLDTSQYDVVPFTEFSRTIPLDIFSDFNLGFHVFGVKPVVCRTCSPCGAACGPTAPGYDRALNEQGITILSDPNCPPVSLTVQPQNQTYQSPLTLTVQSSSPDARYDWYWMGDPHWALASTISDPGSTNPSVTVPNSLQSNVTGFYWVVATSPCGQWARSNLVAVCSTPTVNVQPQDLTVPFGQNATLMVKAAGTGLSYQWYVDAGTPSQWIPIPAESSNVTVEHSDGQALTMTSFQTPPVTATHAYFVEVRDVCGNVIATRIATVAVQFPARRRVVAH